MSTIVETEERPSCLPGRTNDLHFPKMKGSLNTSNVRNSLDGTRHFANKHMHQDNASLCQNVQNSEIDSRKKFGNQNCRRSNETDKDSYIHSSVCESSALLKLPNINNSKSNRIACLANEMHEHGHMSSTDKWNNQSSFKQSPRCLLQLDCSKKLSSEDNISDCLTEGNSQNHCVGNKHVNSLSTHQEDIISVRFPSIFQHQNGHNTNFHCSFSTANNIAQVNQDPNQPSFSSLSRQSMTLIGRKSKLSPRTESMETPRSCPGSYALLLPISTSLNYSSRVKGKRKRANKKSVN